MNIKDIRKKIDSGELVLPEGDMLELMFERQNELIDRYHPIEEGRGALVIDREDFGKLDYRFVQWRLKDVIGERCVEELMEAMNCLRNKPWKQSEVETDVDHYFEELVDALHFFIEGCITSGIDARLLFMLYYMKSEVNKFRQDTRY